MIIIITIATLTLFVLMVDRERDPGPVRIICPHCNKDCSVAIYQWHVSTHDR